MGSVRFYSVSERRRYDPSRSVTGSSTDEVRRSLYPAHGREADTRTGRGNDFGVSVRTVRRWEDRFEADGAEGLYDPRIGKLANNRVPAIRLWRCWICSTANTGIIRSGISTRSLSPSTGLPGATTGYASHYSVMAGFSRLRGAEPTGVNGPAAQWSA